MISRIKKFAGRSQRPLVLISLFIVVVFAAASISVIRYRSAKSSVQTINYSDLFALAEAGTGASVIIDGDAVMVTRLDGAIVQSTVAGESFRQTIVELFRKNHVPVQFASARPSFIATAFTYSWPLMVIGLFALVGWQVHATMTGR